MQHAAKITILLNYTIFQIHFESNFCKFFSGFTKRIPSLCSNKPYIKFSVIGPNFWN